MSIPTNVPRTTRITPAIASRLASLGLDFTKPATVVSRSARVQAHLLADLGGRTFTAGRTAVTITDGPRAQGGVLELSLRLVRAGTDITPPDLNPIRIVNPPLKVDDGLGGWKVDPVAALREVVADVLRARALL